MGEANSGLASKSVNYARTTAEQVDFTPGQMEFTGNPLHMAINGDGFFQVERPDGSTGYSRSGSFQLDPEGQLIDSHRRLVLSADGGPIALTHSEVDIAPNGSIYADGAQVGQIGLFQFADNSVLQRAGEGIFQARDNSQPAVHPNPQMIQKNIETSNVDMMKAMVRMTTNTRTFEATQKALRIYSDMSSKSIELGLLQ